LQFFEQAVHYNGKLNSIHIQLGFLHAEPPDTREIKKLFNLLQRLSIEW